MAENKSSNNIQKMKDWANEQKGKHTVIKLNKWTTIFNVDGFIQYQLNIMEAYAEGSRPFKDAYFRLYELKQYLAHQFKQ